MVGEAIAGLNAVRTAFDIAKTLHNMHDVAARDRAVIDLQKEILTAQAAQATLIQRVSDLEKEMARFETWEADKKRYKLTDYGGETFAYELKADSTEAEPSHRICPACYQNGNKSILQATGKNIHKQDTFKCPRCDKTFALGRRIQTDLGGASWGRNSP